MSTHEDDAKAPKNDGHNAPSLDEVRAPLPSDHEEGIAGPANAPFAPADITPPADDTQADDDKAEAKSSKHSKTDSADD